MARGIRDAAGATAFFALGLGQGHDPFLMKGMESAVDVLVSAARAREKIVVFGDYDVDGVTAVAQLRAVLRALGADSVPFLPHRVRDGYGLKPETFRRVFEQHRPKAIVTVDCGITAVEAVAEAAAAGVAVVITDHHLPADVLPEGASVVNPKQPGCGLPVQGPLRGGRRVQDRSGDHPAREALARRGVARESRRARHDQRHRSPARRKPWNRRSEASPASPIPGRRGSGRSSRRPACPRPPSPVPRTSPFASRRA